MFQSAMCKARNANRFFYLSRSLPRSCKRDISISKSRQQSTISANQPSDNICEDLNPQRCYSTVKISAPKRQNPFNSVYSTKSRYDSIMNIKPKKLEHKSRSMSFHIQSQKSELDRTEISEKLETRLDKIMSIHVVKPNVTSTLKNYEPLKTEKPHPIKKIKRQKNELQLWRESKRKLQRMQKQEEKENMLWQNFEREREKRYLQKKREQKTATKKEREREKRFERMVEKELQRIEEQSEIRKRKADSFSPYVYPLY